jgi:adenylylsulfate kinase
MLMHNGMILWLTGLPAAGKTTIANLLSARLQAEGATVHVLDGDVIRQMHLARLGFSREERITHILQVSNTAMMLKEQGLICIVALIAPYLEIRQAVMKMTGAIEIFVDAPLETCRQRDPKGLYSRAMRGEIKNFTGIDDPYDPPLTPDIHLHTERETPEESTGRVLEYLQIQGYFHFQEEHLGKIYRTYPQPWGRKNP